MEIRLAKKEDIPRIMAFIKENWSTNHILANHVGFMKYQHTGRHDEFTYILAEEEGKIYGIEGYIPMNGEKSPDIAGALWKVISSNYFMLGRDIREQLIKLTNCRYICSTGINKNTSGQVYERYGHFVNKMGHYYRLRDLPEYHIAKIKNKKLIPSEKEIQKYHFQQIFQFEEMDRYLSEEYLKTKIPYKDKLYLKHRYFEHPFYQYNIYALQKKEMCSFIVMREIEVNGSKMAKIIDFIGEDEDLIGLSRSWDILMEKNGYEYIDLYCYGISEDILYKSGFVERKSSDENIIPNYFEPYELRNVEIYFVSNVLEGLHLYRGDGDQDRPSFYKIDNK